MTTFFCTLCFIYSYFDLIFRSYLVEQDWTQKSKREGTFVLDSPDSNTGSRPASSRVATSTPIMKTSLIESKSRSGSLSRIPPRKLTTPNNHVNGSVMHNGSSSGDLMEVVRQVEETISPLARANSQITETLAQLESNLIMLKSVSVGIVETNNNDSFNDDSF